MVSVMVMTMTTRERNHDLMCNMADQQDINIMCSKREPMLSQLLWSIRYGCCAVRTEGNGTVIRVCSTRCISDLDIILLATT